MTDETRTVGVFAGRHVLAELGGIAPELLDDVEFLRSALWSAVTEAGATVCDMLDHRFEPQGVTVLAMLAESHASIHTYPELGAVFIDVFTCGDRADPEQAVRLFAAALGTDPVALSTVRRGHAPVEGEP
ncbi:MAG: speH [Amycolatopsis sp.]|jgi:S-adenosylmethionine decarboxylase|uniref:adenosylmethionine decarboxylase n=1 Tax=Amycolatopsis sp. TaxID=37632 RepID=UPI0026084B40|nr:adenosylmethionine decarboxylase [Amycolatopsis sp.]MCU1679377.1 speH [Amycolatopsis sp.]